MSNTVMLLDAFSGIHANFCHQKLFAHVHVLCILVAATIRGRHLFHSEFTIVQLLFKRATIRRTALNAVIGHVGFVCYSNPAW